MDVIKYKDFNINVKFYTKAEALVLQNKKAI